MSTITKKGQITIPKHFREKLQINEGDNLVFEMKGNTQKKLFRKKFQVKGKKIVEEIFVDTNVFLRFFVRDVETFTGGFGWKA